MGKQKTEPERPTTITDRKKRPDFPPIHTDDTSHLTVESKPSPGGTLKVYSPYFEAARRAQLSRRAGGSMHALPTVCPLEMAPVSHEEAKDWIGIVKNAHRWFGETTDRSSTASSEGSTSTEETAVHSDDYIAAWIQTRNAIIEVEKKLLKLHENISIQISTVYESYIADPCNIDSTTHRLRDRHIASIKGVFDPAAELYRQALFQYHQLLNKASFLGMGTRLIRDFRTSTPDVRLPRDWAVYKSFESLENITCFVCNRSRKISRSAHICCGYSKVLPTESRYAICCTTLSEVSTVAAYLDEFIPSAAERFQKYLQQFRFP